MWRHFLDQAHMIVKGFTAKCQQGALVPKTTYVMFMGSSGDASFRTGRDLAPGNVVIGSKAAQIPCDLSSLSTHDNKTCEAKTYEEYLGTVDICATVEE